MASRSPCAFEEASTTTSYPPRLPATADFLRSLRTLRTVAPNASATSSRASPSPNWSTTQAPGRPHGRAERVGDIESGFSVVDIVHDRGSVQHRQSRRVETDALTSTTDH